MARPTNTQANDLPAGVEAVGEGAEDTTQRAYFGSGADTYPFTPDPALHYVQVHEHPVAWGLSSQFGSFEQKGYTLVQYCNKQKTAAWYSIPQAEYDRRKAAERAPSEELKKRVRQMAKTGDPNRDNISTWVERDAYVKGGAGTLFNPPISFNG